MAEQRTVIVPTHVVDGIIRLNAAMGQRVVSRYDTGGQMSECETVIVFEGDTADLDRDRFHASCIAANSWGDTSVYDCDGRHYRARAGESIVAAITTARAESVSRGAMTLDEVAAAHRAWESADGAARQRADADAIPF